MISVIVKALIYGGIAAASTRVAFGLDNPLIAAMLWIVFGGLCGTGEWLRVKETTRKSTKREETLSEHFNKLSELLRMLVEEEQQRSTDHLDEINNSITECLNKHMDRLYEALGKNATAAREGQETVLERLSQMEKTVAVSAEKLVDGTEQAAERLGGKLDKGLESISDVLDKSTKTVDTNLKALSEQISKMESLFEKHAGESGERIDSIVKTIGEINNRVKTVSANLQSKDWGDNLLMAISEIKETIENLQNNVEKFNDSVPKLAEEISKFNGHYRDNLSAMSNEMKAVVKNISDNYKMLKQLSDRYA